MSPTARYAAALLARATAAFRAFSVGRVDADGSTAAPQVLAALDAFLAAPGPVTYLAAARTIDRAHRDARLVDLGRGAAERSFARGIGRVAEVPRMDPTIVATLRALPIDARAGARLSALAALVEAHDELQDRVAGQAAILRRQLAFERGIVDDQPQRTIRSVRPRAARAARRVHKPK